MPSVTAPAPYDLRFASYANDFEAFASAHNLLIQKYYHDGPTWSFCFAHPRGGQAKLDLTIGDSGTLTLETVWWIDSYSRFTRSLKSGAKTDVPREGKEALAALRDALSMVTSWQTGEWTQVADDYKPIWGRYSEAQFRAMTPQWPEPVL